MVGNFRLNFNCEMVHIDKCVARKHVIFPPVTLPPVTLSEAPRKTVFRLTLEREVEGPRQCVLCHADSGSSTENASQSSAFKIPAVQPRRADAPGAPPYRAAAARKK